MGNYPDSATNPKQIIYIWNYLEWGGAQVYFFGLMKEAKKHSAISLLIPKGTSRQILDFAENEGIPYEFLNLHIKANLEKSLKSKLALHINKLRSELEIISMILFLIFER